MVIHNKITVIHRLNTVSSQLSTGPVGVIHMHSWATIHPGSSLARPLGHTYVYTRTRTSSQRGLLHTYTECRSGAYIALYSKYTHAIVCYTTFRQCWDWQYIHLLSTAPYSYVSRTLYRSGLRLLCVAYWVRTLRCTNLVIGSLERSLGRVLVYILQRGL